MAILPGLSHQRRGIHQRIGYFAGNYQLVDEESTQRMIISPEITSSGKRNPPEEWDSAKNFQLIDKESTQDRVFPPGITSLFMMMQIGKIKIRRKFSEP
jgi:hypothetical protein